MSQALQPLAFVLITVSKDMNSVTLSFSSLPLADVRLTIAAFPDTVTMLDAHEPFAIVRLAILPLINAFAVCFTSLIRSMVRVP